MLELNNGGYTRDTGPTSDPEAIKNYLTLEQELAGGVNYSVKE